MKKNLIFLHLPKNGGTTFHSILDRYFKKEETFWIDYDENGVWNLDYFKTLPPEKRQDIRLLKGHMNFGLHSYLNGDSEYITFLRHPVSRTISFYNYVKNTPGNRLYKQAQERSIVDFITEIQEPDIVNGQIRKISGIDDTPEAMLDKAMENIKLHFSFCGLQERFDDSLVLLSDIYNWNNLRYEKLNVNSKNTPPHYSSVNQHVIDIILEVNKGDLAFYSLMEKEFDRKFSAVPFGKIKSWKLDMENKLLTSNGFIPKVKRKLIRWMR